MIVENGAVFDGFPRTGNQASSLDNMLTEMNSKVDIALNIDVPFDEIVERIAVMVVVTIPTYCSRVMETLLHLLLIHAKNYKQYCRLIMNLND